MIDEKCTNAKRVWIQQMENKDDMTKYVQQWRCSQ